MLLSSNDILDLNKVITSNRDILLYQLGTERTERKNNFRTALNALCDAYIAVSNAYLYRLGMDSVASDCKRTLEDTCERMSKSCETIDNNISSNVSSSQQSSQASFANAVRASRSSTAAARKIMLDQGKPIAIVREKRVIVTPREGEKNKFANSQATKSALYKAVDPVALQLKVKRVTLSRDTPSIVIDGDCVEPLLNCPALKAAGLVATRDTKLDPRVIIHGIPVEYDKDEIVHFLVSQNLPSLSPDKFKVIYIYPAGQKKCRSCIVQMDSLCRESLFQLDKLSIGWQRCRFAHHISIFQCFNCLQFGHKASECVSDPVCGNCAEAHQTSKCKNNKKLFCANCKRSNLSDTHSAFDKAKCATLRTKFERKASRINYGE